MDTRGRGTRTLVFSQLAQIPLYGNSVVMVVCVCVRVGFLSIRIATGSGSVEGAESVETGGKK